MIATVFATQAQERAQAREVQQEEEHTTIAHRLTHELNLAHHTADQISMRNKDLELTLADQSSHLTEKLETAEAAASNTVQVKYIEGVFCCNRRNCAPWFAVFL